MQDWNEFFLTYFSKIDYLQVNVITIEKILMHDIRLSK